MKLELIDAQERLLESITPPVSDDEARLLVTLFGPDDYFGLAWTLVHLIETAPGWPIEECLQNSQNEWVETIRIRSENYERMLRRDTGEDS